MTNKQTSLDECLITDRNHKILYRERLSAVGGRFEVYTSECKHMMITVFCMHEISCEELRWFVLVSTAKLQYNPKIIPRKNFFLHPQEKFASCS